MSRDLRTDARQYTEPIVVHNIEREVVDGQILEGATTDRKAWANVIYDVELSAASNNSNNGHSILKVEIHSPKGIPLVAFKTQMTIRNEKYKVTGINAFNLNSESVIVTVEGI